jgi:molybdate transport system ATP-binding protein
VVNFLLDIRKKLGNFDIKVRFSTDGRRIGILGPSGSGKSMTLKMIAGIETPDEGRICLGERVLFDRAHKINLKPQKRRVGYLFQNYALFPNMTVEQNVGCGLKKKERQEVTDRMIEKFHIQELRNRMPGMLSGGQQQRVALARIMAQSPDLILLDEPFSALDVYLKDQLQRQMEEFFADYTGTVLLVSHDRDEIYRFCDELCVIDDGHVDAVGETKRIFRLPETETAARLTGCKNVIPVERVDDHSVLAAEWGIRFHFKAEVPRETRHLGIRAHDFLPVWGKPEENCIPVGFYRSAELPFETKYYINPTEPDGQEPVCWFVQRNRMEEIRKKGLPGYLKLDEEKVMFLR